jgi:hypothetical protein
MSQPPFWKNAQGGVALSLWSDVHMSNLGDSVTKKKVKNTNNKLDLQMLKFAVFIFLLAMSY